MPFLFHAMAAGRLRRWTLLPVLLLPLLASAAAMREPLQTAQQLVVVIAPDWDSSKATLQTFERGKDGWHAHGDTFEIALGRSGSAWGDGLHPAQNEGPHKREGDGRSPAGIFTIGEAFGYAGRIDSAMPYLPMQQSSYCIDVADSPLYNRIVDADVVGAEAVEGSTEPMRLDLHNAGDNRYREGFVIEHNARAVPGKGSCIFAHLWRSNGEATAGCTAMEPQHMQALLAWLRPEAKPLFVLLPDTEYRRLQHDWSLPGLTGASR